MSAGGILNHSVLEQAILDPEQCSGLDYESLLEIAAPGDTDDAKFERRNILNAHNSILRVLMCLIDVFKCGGFRYFIKLF